MQQVQINIVARLQLKERMDACMQSKCSALNGKAEQIINAENKKRQAQKGRFVTTQQEFMDHRYSSVDSVVTVLEAEECIRKCMWGKDIMQKTFEQNFQEFKMNTHQCF